MDNLDAKAPIQPAANDLQAQYDALRHLVISLLILVLVISGTLNIYLLRQWRSTSRDLAGVRPQAMQMIADYQRVSAPVMSDFIKKITEYGQAHPDFTPILVKYNLRAGTPTNAPSPAPAAPPAAAPKKAAGR